MEQRIAWRSMTGRFGNVPCSTCESLAFKVWRSVVGPAVALVTRTKPSSCDVAGRPGVAVAVAVVLPQRRWLAVQALKVNSGRRGVDTPARPTITV
jgi:hypothetical protein